MRIEDLAPNPKNPRKVTDAKLKQLKQALLVYGDLSGVVYNRKSKQLVGGHQRSKQFEGSTVTIEKQYKKPTRTGTVAEGYIEYEGERYAYREVSWDKHKEMGANLAANKGAGEWDVPELTEWFKELDNFDVDFDLDLTMFDADEREEFGGIEVAAHTRTGATGVDEDDVPEKAPPRTKLGDIYRLGDHRLMCGDSTDAKQVARLMKGAKADITFTSPPYNAAKNGHLTGAVAGFDKKYKNTTDEMTDDDFHSLLDKFTSIALDVSDYVFVNLQLLTHNRAPLFRYQSDYQDRVKDVLIWNKRQCPPNIVKGAFNTKWEYVFCFSKDTKTRGFPCDWRGQYPNVVETESNSGNEFASEHKAGFPVAFPSWFLEKFEFAKTIYEPFCGTGTTMVAAEKFGRRCLAMELDPGYCDVIVERWEKYTGLKAKLVASAGHAKTLKRSANQSASSHA